MDIVTLTASLGPARFDMSGRALGHVLHTCGDAEPIRKGLANRLVNHARKRLEDIGVAVRTDWIVEVETPEAERPPSERSYCVTFVTHKGGRLGVQGILTSNGWPTLDHGPFLDDR